jgi:uncharacterized protein
MLHEQIKNKIKESMLAKDAVMLMTLRNISSALTNELVATGKKPSEVLGDEGVLVVITRLAKQRRDSIEQFKKGNRSDLVKAEEAELAILEKYLPKMMDRGEVEKIVKAKKAELGVDDSSAKGNKGKLMSAVMGELRGKADGKMVKDVVDSLL